MNPHETMADEQFIVRKTVERKRPNPWTEDHKAPTRKIAPQNCESHSIHFDRRVYFPDKQEADQKSDAA